MKNFLMNNRLPLLLGVLILLLSAGMLLGLAQMDRQAAAVVSQPAGPTAVPRRESSPTSPPLIGAVTETPALFLTPKPTQLPIQPPTSTEAPPQGVIWSPQAASVYLREEPNGPIRVSLPNGMRVQLLGEQEEKAGVVWVKVIAFYPNANPAGWVAEKLILPGAQVPLENRVEVQAEEGAYLRAEPGGRELAFLWNGTLLSAQEVQESAGLRWVKVRLPDGAEGWVSESLLGPWTEGIR